MTRELKDMIDNFNEIKYDECISYQRFTKTVLLISSIIKYCCEPYSLIVNENTGELLAVIDIKNKTLLRFTSNKNFNNLCKAGKLSQSKIYH